MKYEYIYQGNIFYYEGSYWLKLLEDDRNKAICLSSYYKELPEGHRFELVNERGEIAKFSDDTEVTSVENGFLLKV